MRGHGWTREARLNKLASIQKFRGPKPLATQKGGTHRRKAYKTVTLPSLALPPEREP
jgi:hypothetical protein